MLDNLCNLLGIPMHTYFLYIVLPFQTLHQIVRNGAIDFCTIKVTVYPYNSVLGQ